MRITETGVLSRREREIALAYTEGASHRAIAERLFIAPSTVRTHIGAIYRKLGVSSKVALLRALNPPREEASSAAASTDPARWASIAIMPFRGGRNRRDDLGDGLAHDIITRLARLRSVRVIARGSVFAMAERGIADEEAARLLDVDYVATGSVRRVGTKIVVAVELLDRRSARILWADSYPCARAGVFDALEDIGDRIVAAVATEIELSERNRAILARPESLGAWESFHRGLWHMYRFTGAHNVEAQALFRRAVESDPTFARAWAGLSFTHFQNAFLLKPEDRAREIDRAFETAGRSLEADERDPTAHWAMGRALWLRGAGDRAVAALEVSLRLAPNFGPGHYALAFVNSQSGDPRAAVGSADHAQALSPFDPLLFGFFGARAMALFRLGAHAEAADFAVRAAERPNAHHHIWMIAALCLAAAGRPEEAREFAARIQAIHPGYRLDDFLTAFRFAPETKAAFRSHSHRIGMASRGADRRPSSG